MSSKLECGTCGYKWSRPASEKGRAECPKCQTPLANAGAPGRAPGEASTFKQSASSAMETEWGKCKKNNGGPHQFKFGKCSNCGMSEGKFNKGPGAAANPGGEGGCSKGGKCVFQFAKCKKCGRSELGGPAPTKSPAKSPKSPAAPRKSANKAPESSVEQDLGLAPKLNRPVSSGRRSPRPSAKTLGAPAAGGTTSPADLAKRAATEFKEIKAALAGLKLTCKSLEVGSDVEIKLCYDSAAGPLTDAAIDAALGSCDSLTGQCVTKALKNAVATATGMDGFALADVHVNMSNSACNKCCFKAL